MITVIDSTDTTTNVALTGSGVFYASFSIDAAYHVAPTCGW